MKNFEYRGFACEHTETGCKLYRNGTTITVDIKSAKKLREYIDKITGNSIEATV